MEALAKVRDLCRAAGDAAAAGRTAEGLGLAAQARDLAGDVLGKGHYAYLQALCALGWLRHQTADGPGATEAFREVEERAGALAETDFEHAAVGLAQAADYAKTAGMTADARRILAEYVALHMAHLGAEHPRYFAAKAKQEQI